MNVSQQYRSKTYLEYEERWRFWRASYLGGRCWYEQGQTHDALSSFYHHLHGDNVHHEEEQAGSEQAYLWRHQRERDEVYKLRLRSSVYWNFVRPHVDAIAAAVAKNSKQCELPKAIQYLETDVDRRGTDLSDFDRSMIAWGLVYGHVNVLVDKPIGEADSLASQREKGLMPYLQLVSPLELVRWSWDADSGVYRWALIKEHIPADVDPMIGSDGTVNAPSDSTRYRLWTPESWTLYSAKGDVLSVGEGHGFVPLVPVIFQKDPSQPEPVGLSFIEDVAELAKLTYNKFSWLTDEERSHCFNQLFVKTAEKLSSQDALALSSNTYLGGMEDAKYLAPNTAPMTHMLDSMKHDFTMARGQMGFESAPGETEGVKSGLAIQLERETQWATMAGIASAFESGKRAALTAACKMAGADPDKLKVTVSRDFSALAASAKIDQLLLALEKGALPDEAKVEAQKELLRGLLPDMSDETRQSIEDALAPQEAGGVEALDSAEAVPPDTALNGAQVLALKDLIVAASAEEIPIESARGIILASFPLDVGQVESIINPVRTFEPKEDEVGKAAFDAMDRFGPKEDAEDDDAEDGADSFGDSATGDTGEENPAAVGGGATSGQGPSSQDGNQAPPPFDRKG